MLRRLENGAAFALEIGSGRRPEGGPKRAKKGSFYIEKGLLRKTSFRLGGSAVSVQNRFVPRGLYMKPFIVVKRQNKFLRSVNFISRRTRRNGNS